MEPRSVSSDSQRESVNVNADALLNEVMESVRRRQRDLLLMWVTGAMVAVSLAFIVLMAKDLQKTPGGADLRCLWRTIDQTVGDKREFLLAGAGLIVALLAVPALSGQEVDAASFERMVQKVLLLRALTVGAFILLVGSWLLMPLPPLDASRGLGVVVCGSVGLLASTLLISSTTAEVERHKSLADARKRRNKIEDELNNLGQKTGREIDGVGQVEAAGRTGGGGLRLSVAVLRLLKFVQTWLILVKHSICKRVGGSGLIRSTGATLIVIFFAGLSLVMMVAVLRSEFSVIALVFFSALVVVYILWARRAVLRLVWFKSLGIGAAGATDMMISVSLLVVVAVALFTFLIKGLVNAPVGDVVAIVMLALSPVGIIILILDPFLYSKWDRVIVDRRHLDFLRQQKKAADREIEMQKRYLINSEVFVREGGGG